MPGTVCERHMIALLQRVSRAEVHVDGTCIAGIGWGVVALIAVTRDDSEQAAARLAERIVGYRLFADAWGRMHESLRDHPDYGVLLIPQFTLAADTRKGMRASFTPAAAPAVGRHLFAHLYAQVALHHAHVVCGRFGIDMQVNLINEGPVTFWLEG